MGTSDFVLLLCRGGEGNGILGCPWPLSNLALCLALLSAMQVQTGNETLNPGVGEGEAALTIFLLLSRSQKKWRVSGSFSRECLAPMAPADNRKWQRRETQLAAVFRACQPAHVSHRRGASLHRGPDSIGAHRESIPQKARAPSRGRSPASDPPRQQSQDLLLPETWLSWKFWGRKTKPWTGPSPSLSWTPTLDWTDPQSDGPSFYTGPLSIMTWTPSLSWTNSQSELNLNTELDYPIAWL